MEKECSVPIKPIKPKLPRKRKSNQQNDNIAILSKLNNRLDTSNEKEVYFTQYEPKNDQYSLYVGGHANYLSGRISEKKDDEKFFLMINNNQTDPILTVFTDSKEFHIDIDEDSYSLFDKLFSTIRRLKFRQNNINV